MNVLEFIFKLLWYTTKLKQGHTGRDMSARRVFLKKKDNYPAGAPGLYSHVLVESGLFIYSFFFIRVSLVMSFSMTKDVVKNEVFFKKAKKFKMVTFWKYDFYMSDALHIDIAGGMAHTNLFWYSIAIIDHVGFPGKQMWCACFLSG